MMAKLHACDTWQGLRVWGCGALLFGAADPKPDLCCVLVEVVWKRLP